MNINSLLGYQQCSANGEFFYEGASVEYPKVMLLEQTYFEKNGFEHILTFGISLPLKVT